MVPPPAPVPPAAPTTSRPLPPTVPMFASWRHPGHLLRSLAFVAGGMALAPIAFSITITLLSTTVGLLVTFVFALPVAWALFVTARGLGHLERSRIEALLHVTVPDGVPPLSTRGWLRRLWERTRSGARWREIVHHLVRFPVNVIGFAVTAAAWCGSAALVGLPIYAEHLPGGTAKFGLFEIGAGAGAWAAAGVGLIGLALVAPLVTGLAAAAELAIGRALLGPRGDAVLRAEVDRLETSRTAAVDSAEAERRRIERDLHDGAQQRLVALAADLGVAKETFDTDPEAAKRIVAGAHEEAKTALKEIRDLVRGIHPVILEDRGLDAALSAVVARSPVPVALDVAPMERPPAAVESAAYFVVNEALTNVARHARATRVHVTVARAGDRLVVEIRDDGVGGADASAGTGLQGLRDRVTGLGGSLVVVSPPGGPTTISVELPCGS